MIILTYGVFIGYLLLTTILANQEGHTKKQKIGDPFAASPVQILLFIGAALILLSGLFVMTLAVNGDQITNPADGNEVTAAPEISMVSAVSLFLATGVMGVAAFSVILSYNTRRALQHMIGKRGQFDPQSVVHTTATVFALLILTGQLVSFVLQGGISGMAESINEEGIPLSEVIFQALLQVLIAFLGIGWIVRRSLPQALERLGLLMPSRDDVTQGIVTGLKLIVLIFVYAYIMGILINVGVFSESTLEQQNEAADSMVKAFSTLPLAVALALSAAVGEEILFRGALQPVFGNTLTSIFFVLMHTQNLISPGIVMLFIVSYLLGILREQRNTTAAMIGHFVYDFLVIVISMMAASAEAA